MNYLPCNLPSVSVKMIKSVTIFSFVFFITLSCRGQNPDLKHQVSVGIWPEYAEYPYLNLDYKHFYKPRKFFGIGLEGYLNNFSLNVPDSIDYKYYKLIPSVFFGKQWPFFKILRFGLSARVSGFFDRNEAEYPTKPTTYYRRNGIFLGPELRLDVVPFKKPGIEILIFGKIHSGFGWMSEDNKYYSKSEIVRDTEVYRETIGTLSVGIGVIF